MSPAIFGLLGVLVGGAIAGFSAYFMDRRRGWLAARAAGLLTIDDLEVARSDVERARPDFAAATPAIDSSLHAWASYREALLYRRGTSPSGVTASEWLELGKLFKQLTTLGDRTDPFAEADAVFARLLGILGVFEEDRHAFPLVVRNAFHSIVHPRRSS